MAKKQQPGPLKVAWIIARIPLGILAAFIVLYLIVGFTVKKAGEDGWRILDRRPAALDALTTGDIIMYEVGEERRVGRILAVAGERVQGYRGTAVGGGSLVRDGEDHSAGFIPSIIPRGHFRVLPDTRNAIMSPVRDGLVGTHQIIGKAGSRDET